MHRQQAVFAYGIAIVTGCALWILAAVFGGRTEAWDSPFYWSLSYPLAIAAAGAIAWRVPEKPWRWGLAIMFAQAVVLVLTAGDYSLLPLGLVMFGLLALPAIALGYVCARIRLGMRAG